MGREMKKFWLGSAAFFLLSAGAVIAADMPVKAPVYKAPAPVYSWTGWYAGANFGTGISQSRVFAPSLTPGGDTLDLNKASFTGGLQAGYNWQFNPNWLAGIEGDIGYLGINRQYTDWNQPTGTQVGLKTSWYSTLRARFGYVTGPSLFYATGGAAFVHVKDTFGDPPLTTASFTKTGWTAGGGIETKLSRNWSTTTEYLYIDAGHASFASNYFAATNVVTFNHHFHIIKTGLNYKFGEPDEGLPFFGNAALLAPVHNWTGLYSGVNAGGAFSTTRARGVLTAGETDINGSGFTGGGQIGYNVMIAPKWIVGIEGDLGHLGISRSFFQWDDAPVTFGEKAGLYGTLRGRVGTTTGPAFLYVTGGAAFARIRDTLSAGGGVVDSSTKTATGWTYGGGTEVALDPRWSLKLEYLRIKLSDDHRAAGVDATFEPRFTVVRVGLNYKFGDDFWGKAPVVAKY